MTEIVIWVEDDGSVRWNDRAVDMAILEDLMRQAAQQEPKPSLKFKGSETVSFDDVSKVMDMAARYGLFSKHVGVI